MKTKQECEAYLEDLYAERRGLKEAIAEWDNHHDHDELAAVETQIKTIRWVLGRYR